MSKRSIAVLAGAVALALMSGCGGGEEEESLTRAELIKRGDAICTEANEQSKERYEVLAKKNAKNQSAQSLEEEGIEVGEKVLVPNAEEQAAGLAELSPPEGEEAKLEAIVEAIEAGVATATSDPSSFYGKTYPFEEANKLMSEYGFKVCGGGSQA